jgi:hypothetical protein
MSSEQCSVKSPLHCRDIFYFDCIVISITLCVLHRLLLSMFVEVCCTSGEMQHGRTSDNISLVAAEDEIKRGKLLAFC